MRIKYLALAALVTVLGCGIDLDKIFSPQLGSIIVYKVEPSVSQVNVGALDSNVAIFLIPADDTALVELIGRAGIIKQVSLAVRDTAYDSPYCQGEMRCWFAAMRFERTSSDTATMSYRISLKSRPDTSRATFKVE